MRATSSVKSPIPAVWRIDVEPDEHQPEVRQKPWQGFVSTAALVEELREPLARRSGRAVHPTWFVRLDPDIERCFGQADFVVRRHSEVFDRLIGHKDPLGIHVHPHRWDEERSVAFSDHADDAWTTHCLTVAAETFAHCFGEPVRRSSQGGYFLTETIPKIYWDLVAQAADDQPACYFAFAIRTDAPGSVTQERVRRLLEHLPNHPVAERLQFVDPLGPEIQALATPSGE
jgi:hypothetical protein